MTALRLDQKFLRAPLVTVVVDGRPVIAHAGENLAAALMAAGVLDLRRSPRAATPRGAFCLMGVCQECAVHIDGVLRQACMVPVADGMRVECRGSL